MPSSTCEPSNKLFQAYKLYAHVVQIGVVQMFDHSKFLTDSSTDLCLEI